MTNKAAQYVYFMRQVGGVGPIKIGVSASPKSRLDMLATWSPTPLELVAVIPGDAALERNIHECFADYHSHREWFNAGPRLVAALAALVSGEPIERAVDLDARIGKLPNKKDNGRHRREAHKSGRLDLIKETCGGTSGLAAKLNAINPANPITPQAVSQWQRVPVSRAVDVEAVSGIPRYELRPDVFRQPEGAAP